jgi:hypothetical protein
MATDRRIMQHQDQIEVCRSGDYVLLEQQFCDGNDGAVVTISRSGLPTIIGWLRDVMEEIDADDEV